MGEDSIILPIDRVISEGVVVGTRAEKRLCNKLNKYSENKRSLVIKYSPASHTKSLKFVGLVFTVLMLSGCLLTLVGTWGHTTMAREYGELSDDEGSRREEASMQFNADEMDNLCRSIVEGLGLERIPDPSKANVSQTEYERAHVEYLRRLQLSRAPGDKRRQRLHTFHATEESVNGTRRHVNQTDTRYFSLDIPDDEEVDQATLRLILMPTEAAEVEVAIYRPGDRSHAESKVFLLDAPRWVEMDVTDMVTAWHPGIIDSLALEMSVSPGVSLAEPVLNVFSTTGNIRQRRSAPDHLMSLHRGRKTECRGDNKRCCRHEMTVKFKDLKGFEFIIQPKDFDAGYCKGRCPPRYNPAHPHALLQSLIWKEDRRKAPRPCCAPSKLAELEILYFDENDASKLKVLTWKNMRVLECACS